MLITTFSLTSMLLLSTLIKERKWKWTSLIISILIISFIILIQAPITLPKLSIISSSIDQLRTLLVSLTIWISALILIASQKIIQEEKKRKSFMLTLTRLSFVLVIAFTTHNILLFYIFFEASLIPTLLLILGWGYQPERLQAGIYLIIYTVTASLPLLLSLIFIYQNSFHLSITLHHWSLFQNNRILSMWWLITISAFLVKTPLYLTHLWLPKAHVEAPVAGSIVLAGILLKLGSYGLLRIRTKFIILRKTLSPIIIRVSLIGGVITSLICVRQTDVKSLIAYSSVRHIGLATAGIMSNTLWGWQGAFIILLAHGLCSSCIFALANITYETTHSRRIYITKGLITLFPAITFWWFWFSACNIAAPPSLNLGAEIILISRALSFSTLTAIPLSLIAFLAAAYSLLLYTSTQHGQSPIFHNPLSLFTPRNITISLLHFIPLITLILKIDFLTIWIWPYSWKTTLNCRFKSVPSTEA